MAIIPDGLVIDRLQNIARLNSGLIGRTTANDDAGLDSVGALDPRCAVIRWRVTSFLLDVQAAQNEDSDRQQNGRDVIEGEDLPTHLCPIQQPVFQKIIQITPRLTISAKAEYELWEFYMKCGNGNAKPNRDNPLETAAQVRT